MRRDSIPALVVTLVLTVVLLVLVPILHLPTTLFAMLAIACAFMLSMLLASMFVGTDEPRAPTRSS